MPETTAVTKYDHKELAALMVKDQGIKSGHWMIQATFSWAVTNVVSSADSPSGPAVLTVLAGIGIQEAAEASPFTVDAATLWEETPARRRRRKNKKA
ncbi:MAG: hypothetical protein IH959_05190 [Chloroflexi bacterium]|nr:hypothetical protein [Chloroflexota bacterium]